VLIGLIYDDGNIWKGEACNCRLDGFVFATFLFWVCVTTLFSFGTCTAVLLRAAGVAACTRTRTRARMAAY